MGVDPLELPLIRLVGLIYHIQVRHMKEKDRARHDSELWRVPPGVKPSDTKVAIQGFDEESEMSSFMSLAGQVGGLKS